MDEFTEEEEGEGKKKSSRGIEAYLQS